MFKHFEALEADFAREYPFVCGGDLRQALWGEDAIGVRRIIALVKGLPPRSAFARQAYSDGKDWGNTEELLSTLTELVDFSNRMTYARSAKKGEKVWDPIKIPRPYDELKEKQRKERRKVATGDELVKFFNRGSSGRVQLDEA